MTTDQRDPRGRFYAWRNLHPHEAEDPATVWAAAWQAGAWDAIRRNSSLGLNLAQIVQRLEELAALYADVDQERQFERELSQPSTYWPTT
jgi:hypothetical protein